MTLSLEEQIALHEKLTNESHRLNWLRIEPLPDGRVRATSDFGWEATEDGGKRIEADCGEDWIIERGPDGQLRFARYLTSSMRYLPGSAQLDLHHP